MKNLKEAVLLVAVVSLSIPTLSWSGEEVDATAITPCPFLNVMIREGKIDRDKTGKVTVKELVEAAQEYGINANLMEKLAGAVAESDKETVELSKLLEADRAPAHPGALARADKNLDTVDVERLDQLESFASQGRISLDQLHAYQRHCWKLGKKLGLTAIINKTISDSEVELLWALFGAYRENVQGVDTVKLELVQDFLRFNILPEHFKMNKTDPVTVWTIIKIFFHNRFLPWATPI